MATNSPSIPQGYETLIQQMSAATGLPQQVIEAQANTESGFNANAVSPAGAEGWLQFLPSTYNTYASQAGVAAGTEFNPADEAKVYDIYMGQLLQQYSGNVQQALEAYNAGPSNLSAGSGYAQSILSAAGEPINLTSSTQTTGAFGIPGLPTFSVSSILGNVFGDLRDVFERLGLILFGGVLILLGIHILSGGGGGGSTTNVYETASNATEPASKSSAKTSTAEASKAAAKTGASEAVEAAAVA